MTTIMSLLGVAFFILVIMAACGVFDSYGKWVSVVIGVGFMAIILADLFLHPYIDSITPKNYYRVTLNNGKILKVAEFREPEKNMPYFTGEMDGKTVVLEDIFSYEETDETYTLKDLHNK